MDFWLNICGVIFVVGLVKVPFISGALSPVHDLKEKANMKNEAFLLNSPQPFAKKFDNILKVTKNVTQNQQLEETLYQISKDLVTSILGKMEIQDKITRITKEALEAPGKNKGITAIETRRILDYISRTMSGHILSITRSTTEPELHRLIYGLGQIAAETAIVSALKDNTYTTVLSKRQSIDLSLRKKRSVDSKIINAVTTPPASKTPSKPSNITAPSQAKPKQGKANYQNKLNNISNNDDKLLKSPYSVFSNDKKPVHVVTNVRTETDTPKGFLNQTALDIENEERLNDTDAIVMENPVNTTHELVDVPNLDLQEPPVLLDDWLDKPALNADVVAEMEIDRTEVEDEAESSRKAKQRLEKMELKARKAILYAGDVAYLTAASIVAMRRALTASIEVQMSVKYAKNGMANHQELMMNLAKTAAQQAGKEAKSANSKSLACERVIKLALKYTAQSFGAKLNHVANRIIMDTLPLANLAKSMAFVSSDIAINSLYQATDVKPPSK